MRLNHILLGLSLYRSFKINNMKKLWIAAFSLLLIAGNASAQEKGQKKEMAKELGLSEAQKAEMKKIHEAELAELEALKKNEQLTPEQARETRKAIQEKYREQFKNVLTAEQQARAKAMHEKKGHQGMKKNVKGDSTHPRGKGPKNAMAKHKDGTHHPGMDPAEKMAEKLDLTSEQKEKLSGLRESFRKDAEAIKKNEGLSKEERQAAFKTLAEKHQKDMKAVLTASQLEKWESLKKEEKKRSK